MEGFKTIIEPFRIKSVEPIQFSNWEERMEFLKKANYNVFRLNAIEVMIDFLTDSGTSAMSSKQWSGIMQGDESYAGASSWHKLRDAIHLLTGHEVIFPVHQGRAGERMLYGILGGKDKIFISNSHFDTTRANIELGGAEAIDIPCSESNDPTSSFPFKGNIDLKELEKSIEKFGAQKIAGVIMTVTNNMEGGHPVSMENIRGVAENCKRNSIPLIIDCCRIAENSYFIKKLENGFENKTATEIAKEIFAYSDAAIMSAKKDALVNMGGFLTLKDNRWSDACRQMLVITEGFPTYGGLSGRDMEAMAVGLSEGFEEPYLQYRLQSTSFLGEILQKLRIPVLFPFGGHAVYVDAGALFPHIPAWEYPGQALAAELYLTGGLRASEIGSVMRGKYSENGDLIPATKELVRLAIPRRVYTQSHFEYVGEIFKKVSDRRDKIKGYKIIEEPQFLRHFTCKFEPIL